MASVGRPASDYNELVLSLSNMGFQTIAVEHRGIKNNKGLKEKNITLIDLASDLKLVYFFGTTEPCESWNFRSFALAPQICS